MKTRTGKIARLPKPIRDDLNQRLENGADGPELLAWLNALPEVQRILAEKFGGRPLTKHNLSDWRRGGYAEWSATRDGRRQWQDLLEQGCALDQKRTTSNGVDVTDCLSTFLIVELAQAIDELHQMENSAQRWKILQMISRALARLQNAHSRDKRIRLWEIKKQTSGLNSPERLENTLALEGRQKVAPGNAAQQQPPGVSIPIKPLFHHLPPRKANDEKAPHQQVAASRPKSPSKKFISPLLNQSTPEVSSHSPAPEGRQKVALGQAAQQPQPGVLIPIKPTFSSFAPVKGE